MTIMPCPFCGKRPYTETIRETDKIERTAVICKTSTCIAPRSVSVMPTGQSHENAIKRWNRRVL